MERIREFTDKGYRIQLDLSQQVLELDIPALERWGTEEGLLFPAFPRVPSTGFASAAALAFKAKQFDDGLYAAAELAAQNGAGRFPGKVLLLTTLARALAETARESAAEALAILCGACKLGGLDVAISQAIETSVSQAVTQFLGDELRSKPVGFYSWTRDLEAIFRQDRMLQSPMRSEAGGEALARVLKADDDLRGAYLSYLELISRLTNPFAKPDLRLLLADAGKDGRPAAPEEIFFFPPSRAPETDLIKKLYGDRPIPDGFTLMEELIARIRSGALRLTPTERSGWYDHQTWSLEPLAIPERMPEAKRLRFDKRYSEHLLELFKGIHALTRETHVKQLELPETASPLLKVPRKEIFVRPELSTEPLATFYLRRAQAYRFVRQVLAGTFGLEALRRLHRLTPTGSSKPNLAEEIDEMESLFYGAYATVCRQLGLAADVDAEAGSGEGLETSAGRFEKWASNLPADEDLSQDARMMVPVFYDLERRKTKVWLFLGWTSKFLRINFATPPGVVRLERSSAERAATGALGSLFGIRRQPKIVFAGIFQELACPVTAEVYVEKILDRSEFRRHCDTYKNQSAILANLT